MLLNIDRKKTQISEIALIFLKQCHLYQFNNVNYGGLFFSLIYLQTEVRQMYDKDHSVV